MLDQQVFVNRHQERCSQRLNLSYLYVFPDYWLGRLGHGKEYFAISLNYNNLYEKRKVCLETFCCIVHVILMIPNINNIYVPYIILL